VTIDFELHILFGSPKNKVWVIKKSLIPGLSGGLNVISTQKIS